MISFNEVEMKTKEFSEAAKKPYESRFFPALISYSTLVILVSLSFLASFAIKKFIDGQVQTQLDHETEEKRLIIYNQMERYINYLQSAKALFAASVFVDRKEWKTFVESYGLFEKYPGIVATAYIERVKSENKETFLSEVRSDTHIAKEGYPDFKIFPEGERSEYFVVKYVEPDSERQALMGFDIGSESIRRNALERARDLDVPVATGRYKLLQDTSDVPAMSFILPIYKNGSPVSTIEERREALEGFVRIGLRTQPVFEALQMTHFYQGIRYRIYDGEMLTRYLTDDHLLYDSALGKKSAYDQVLFSTFTTLNIAERVWTIRVDGGPQFFTEFSNGFLPYYILLAGMVFSALVFSVVYLLTSARFRTEEMAKKMLQKLQTSESIFHTMTDHSPLGVILNDIDGQTRYVNGVAQQLVGLNFDECLGSGWLNAIHPDDSERIRSEWQRIINGKQPVRTDFRFARKDRTVVWVHANIAPIQQKSHVFGYAAVLEDISERMFMEIALRESEEYNRSLFDQSPIGLILCDTNGSIMDVNAAFSKVVGRSVKECLGITYWEMVSKEKVDYEKILLRNLQLSDTKAPHETELVHKNGSLTAVRIWSSIIQKGEMPFIISSVEDINDRKQIEEGLRRAQDDLIEAEKTSLVAKLAAGAAHEVKNPLAIILQGIDYISGCVNGKDKEASQVLLEMSRAVKRADGIVKGLLDVAVFTELSLKQENINQIIEDSIHLIKHLADQKHIAIVKKLTPIPALRLDRNKIIHILLNIFGNALDAMKEGGSITVETRLVSENLKKFACVYIEDTGHGIPAEVLGHIFEPFFTTKRGKGGTGLGLSLVKSMVQMHNGLIEIENKKDQSGAQVRIMFPIL